MISVYLARKYCDAVLGALNQDVDDRLAHAAETAGYCDIDHDFSGQ